MKMPNGYGSVHKLPGNRRNPYVAKKTKGWEINPDTGKVKQIYETVGYYPTRKEALTALMTHDTPVFPCWRWQASDKVIKKIVGHKGQGVTETVYTHFEVRELIDAINKI